MDPDEPPSTVHVSQRGLLAAAAAVVAVALIAWVATSFPDDPEIPTSDPAAAGLAALSSWLAQPPPALNPRELLAKKAGGERVMRVLEAPDRASAHLVRGDGFHQRGPDLELVDGPVPIDGPTLARLATTLVDPGSYQSHFVSGCGPSWHVWLRLEKGDDVVDVLICFRCAQVKLLLAGEKSGWLQFGPGSAQFAALAREIFPKDASLRAW